MTVIQLHPVARPPLPGREPPTASEPGALAPLLIGQPLLGQLRQGQAPSGPPTGCELPSPAELLGALLAMAEGTRRKALLPLSGQPAELAMLRRGANVLVSYYHTDSAPEVLVLDRRVPLRALLDAAASDLASALAHEADPWNRELGHRLVKRAAEQPIAAEPDAGVSATRRLGGALEDPGEKHAIAFGFEAAIFPTSDASRDAISHADVHAMLFGGTLWAWVRGRRVPLSKGPILLAAQRMVGAVRALVDAAESERALNERLRSGSFVVAVRRERGGEVALTVGSEDDGVVTIPALDTAGAALPVLRLASDLLRALVSVDRTQTRNLRVASLREEVRRLRRIVRSRTRTEGFVNQDPDRLRVSTPPSAPKIEVAKASPAGGGQLRFLPRWTATVDGLDAASTFFCGDRLVLATPRRAMALDRDTGGLLWQKEGAATSSFLAGTALVRTFADGKVELRELGTGEALLRARLAPRLGGPPFGLFVGGGAMPPTAVLAEGRDRLAALDLRTGELRWKFSGRGACEFRVERSGRLLLVAGGDRSLHAIDAVTGEVAWRYAADGRVCFAPIVRGEHVVLVLGEPGRGESALVGLDLYSGKERFRRALDASVSTGPVLAGDLVVLAVTGSRRGSLLACDPHSGETAWMTTDPGLGVGGAALALDRALVINSPRGSVHALDLETGETQWSRNLAHPVSDDVPRRLDPVLRGGALFVPAAAVHVLRTSDGTSIGGALPCDLVPDVMQVDERGWVFVAEESGHVSAFAPAPHLTLLR